MIKNYIENANFEDTGFAYTLSLISGKHKMVILYCLMEFETVRFNELKRYLKTISDKTLSTNLKELEKDRLIIRTEYPQLCVYALFPFAHWSFFFRPHDTSCLQHIFTA